MEAQLVQLLAPFLSSLLTGAGEQVQAIGGEVVQTTWKHAKRIWDRLCPSLEAKEAAKEAAADVAASPGDGDSLASLRKQLKKLLDEDTALAKDLTSMLDEARLEGVNATTISIAGNVIAKARDNGIAIAVIGGNAKIGH